MQRNVDHLLGALGAGNGVELPRPVLGRLGDGSGAATRDGPTVRTLDRPSDDVVGADGDESHRCATGTVPQDSPAASEHPLPAGAPHPPESAAGKQRLHWPVPAGERQGARGRRHAVLRVERVAGGE